MAETYIVQLQYDPEFLGWYPIELEQRLKDAEAEQGFPWSIRINASWNRNPTVNAMSKKYHAFALIEHDPSIELEDIALRVGVTESRMDRAIDKTKVAATSSESNRWKSNAERAGYTIMPNKYHTFVEAIEQQS